MQSKGKYDLRTPDAQRLQYVDDAIGILAGSASPPRRGMCTPGALRSRTGCDKARRARPAGTRRAGRAGAGRTAKSGSAPFPPEGAADIRVPYDRGRPSGAGRRMCRPPACGGYAQDSGSIRLATPRVSGCTLARWLLPEMQHAINAMKECAAGEYLANLSVLSPDLSEETVYSQVMPVQAQNSDIGLSAREIDMLLDRMEHRQAVKASRRQEEQTPTSGRNLPAGFPR